MAVDAPTRRVIDAYQARTDRLRQQIVRYLTLSWGALPDYRSSDIDAFVARIVPVVEGSLRQMGAMTDAYLAAIETVVSGERATTIGVEALTTERLRGVAASEVYQRAGIELWTALSNGTPFPDAWQQGLDRATSLATTDLQLAKTHTTRAVLARKRNVSGYRRVLEGSKSCGLCIIASTQRYHKGDLMPIHPGCDCGVLPIYGEDPGRVIDKDALDAARDAIAERFGPDVDQQSRKRKDDTLRTQDVLITHQHGEIGPVLGVRGQHFTGPSDL